MNAVAPRLLTCVGLVAAVGAGCRNTATPRPSQETAQFPVAVTEVHARDVEYTLSAVGSVEAYERLPVTARVAGVIERVLFTEGDVVKQGQVLAEIAIDRYLLAVKAAEAALQRAEAARGEARAGLARRQDALSSTPGLIPGEELETWQTRVQTLSAEVEQARVAVRQAQLNLAEARVIAPAAGVIQTRDAATGQYAQPGTQLATLLRRDPLLLRFQVAESDAAELKRGSPVRFHLRNLSQDMNATIIHVAGSANEASRMVPVVARVDTRGVTGLRAGAFAQVTIPLRVAREAPVIPESAVRPTEKGFLAYVVSGNTVAERKLTLGLRTGDGHVEVREGLEAGEQLVIRGVEALRDGAAVRVEEPRIEVGQVGEHR
jgi:multidrug efflux system membrane fusion protein